jgi:hypothetical protein
LRTQIIRIIIAGAESISAKENAPFDFRAETSASSPGIELQHQVFGGRLTSLDRRRPFDPQSVTHTIKAREVGARFGGSNDVIGRYGVFSVRERDLDDFSAQFGKLLHGCVYRLLHLRIEATDHVFFGEPDFQPLNSPIEAAGIVGKRLWNTGRISMIQTTNDA